MRFHAVDHAEARLVPRKSTDAVRWRFRKIGRTYPAPAEFVFSIVANLSRKCARPMTGSARPRSGEPYRLPGVFLVLSGGSVMSNEPNRLRTAVVLFAVAVAIAIL